MNRELRGRRLRILGANKDVTLGALIRAGKPEHITAVEERPDGYRSTLFTMFRPARPRGMSPVAYYRKHKCVDDACYRVHNGRYYCNPAHCKQSWKDKKARDAHLDGAFAALG
jgi:hypothetical protein